MSEKRAIENPATGEIAGYAADLTPAEAAETVEKSAAAFGGWAAFSPVRRGKILSACADRIRSESEKLAILLTKEQGKPIAESRREIRGVCDVFDFFAGLSGTFAGQFHENENGWAFTIKKPLGVCLAVIPWNMPALIMSWKTAPALLAGNTVVVKPSSQCPLTVTEIVALCRQAGLPENVLSIAGGIGAAIGEILIAHPAVRHISFTGSIETGKEIRKIIAASGVVGKRLTLELGGSDAMIVCGDADPVKAAKEAVSGRFFNAGQICVSPKRIFVFDEIYDKFLDAVSEQTAQKKVGNGLDDGVDIGPISSEKQYLRLRSLLSESERKQKEGTATERIVFGSVPSGTGKAGDRFMAPVIAADVLPGSPLLETEIFGPVMAVVRVGGFDEAIEKANATGYGLGASVWTNDLLLIQKAVSALDAGTVWVNQHAKVLPEVPFGGVKESGLGKENGAAVLDDFTEIKTVVVRKSV